MRTSASAVTRAHTNKSVGRFGEVTVRVGEVFTQRYRGVQYGLTVFGWAIRWGVG